MRHCCIIHLHLNSCHTYVPRICYSWLIVGTFATQTCPILPCSISRTCLHYFDLSPLLDLRSTSARKTFRHGSRAILGALGSVTITEPNQLGIAEANLSWLFFVGLVSARTMYVLALFMTRLMCVRLAAQATPSMCDELWRCLT